MYTLTKVIASVVRLVSLGQEAVQNSVSGKLKTHLFRQSYPNIYHYHYVASLWWT